MMKNYNKIKMTCFSFSPFPPHLTKRHRTVESPMSWRVMVGEGWRKCQLDFSSSTATKCGVYNIIIFFHVLNVSSKEYKQLGCGDHSLKKITFCACTILWYFYYKTEQKTISHFIFHCLSSLTMLYWWHVQSYLNGFVS